MSVTNRPVGALDAQGRLIYDSVDDTAFRGEYDGSNNLIYKGFARPGTAEGSLAWQISKLAYDGSNNLVSIKWPQDTRAHATNDYEFSWTARAGYTYS